MQTRNFDVKIKKDHDHKPREDRKRTKTWVKDSYRQVRALKRKENNDE